MTGQKSVTCYPLPSIINNSLLFDSSTLVQTGPKDGLLWKVWHRFLSLRVHLLIQGLDSSTFNFERRWLRWSYTSRLMTFILLRCPPLSRESSIELPEGTQELFSDPMFSLLTLRQSGSSFIDDVRTLYLFLWSTVLIRLSVTSGPSQSHLSTVCGVVSQFWCLSRGEPLLWWGISFPAQTSIFLFWILSRLDFPLFWFRLS